MEYRSSSWFDPRLALRPSPIHAQGMFATAPFDRGQVVLIYGGTLWTRADLEGGKVPPGLNIGFVEDNLVMTTPLDAMDYFINHACDPTIWFRDAVTLVARRPIAANEEITLDYATGDDDFRIEACACGAALCRGTVTGDDWRRPDLRARYGEHWTPLLRRRIAADEAR